MAARGMMNSVSITPGSLGSGASYTEDFDLEGALVGKVWGGVAYDNDPDEWIEIRFYCKTVDLLTVWVKNNRSTAYDPGTLTFNIAWHVE